VIRCIRLWSGEDGQSHFAEGVITLAPGARGDALSGVFPVHSVSFQETEADPKLGWHTDPVRQLVITLAGELTFETRDGSFQLKPGDILFTEDTSGRGHDWKLIGSTPWRRAYAVLDPDTAVPFTPINRRARDRNEE
jgi:hypothetical protein